MNSVDDKSREPKPRIEYSGPEELDRVLVHLREVRERAAVKARRTGARPGPRHAGESGSNTGQVAATATENMALPASAAASAVLAPDAASVPAGTDGEPTAASLSSKASGRTRQAPDETSASAAADTARATSQEIAPPAAQSAPIAPTAPSAAATAEIARQPLLRTGLSEHLAGLRESIAGFVAARAASREASRGPVTDSPPPPPAAASPAATAPTALADRLPSRHGELARAILASSPAFRAMAWFSFASNILMLAGPLFMLQVYDRVLTSGSMPTLVALSILTAAIYGIIGMLELVRSRVIVRVGVELDRRVSDRVLAASLRKGVTAPGNSLAALRELDGLRQFIAGPGPLAFFDAPWTPVYLAVIFLTHWTLGIAATAGAVLLLVIAWLSETQSRAPLAEANKASARSLELAESGQRNAEAIAGLGMLAAYRARWQKANGEALGWQVLAADRLATLGSLSKSLRLLLQSLMLAIGAALAIKGEISAGAIIAGTIIFGRALAPVEQAVGQWRGFVKAREAFAKLEELLKAHPEPARKTGLPPPAGRLEARALRVAAPETRTPILAGISFRVEPGQMVAVIGPSASGKSTLARALVGLWPLAGGEVRLDGSRLDQWNADDLGAHVGYLPQAVELFAGTVRENIARFEADASDAEVIAAAEAAHAHDMIIGLPQGYETELGAFGAYLSAGQRQRIGLARALFRNPALVVLDEPNANLDRVGDEALAAAIDGARARGAAVVLVSHRVQAIGKADLILYLERGTQRAFGPREEVMRFLQQGGGQPAGAGPGAQAAGGAQRARQQ